MGAAIASMGERVTTCVFGWLHVHASTVTDYGPIRSTRAIAAPVCTERRSSRNLDMTSTGNLLHEGV